MSSPGIQNNKSSDLKVFFVDSPSPSVVSDNEGNGHQICSTPINSRKRSFFGSEGESPNMSLNDTLYQSPITMSQELRRLGMDVGWQWNSPKGKGGGLTGNEDGQGQRKRRKSFSCRDKLERYLMGKKKDDQATGFNKIKEELLKAKNNDNAFLKLLEDSAKSDHEDPTLTRKLSDEFLNDSEDENLLIASQELEKEIAAGPVKKTLIEAIQERETPLNFSNDSFDQYLTDIPFDALLNKHIKQLTKDQSLDFTSSSINKSFSRHSSMPESQGKSNNASSGSSKRLMARHESMPSTKAGPSKNVVTTITSSSTESISSSISSTDQNKRACTLTEIERKRRIALERLKTKQSQKSSH